MKASETRYRVSGVFLWTTKGTKEWSEGNKKERGGDRLDGAT